MKKIIAGLIFYLLIFNIPSFSQESETESPSKPEGPDTVKIGTYVISLHDINFHNKEYTMRFWLWMLYNNPEFDFTKQIDVTNAKDIEKPDVLLDTIDGKTWLLMQMKCKMKQSWHVQDYPFDNQELKLIVENTIYDSHSLIYKVDSLGSTYSPEVTVEGWKVTDFNVKTGITNYKTSFGDPRAKKQFSKYGNFEINIKIERNALGLFLKLFVGMYIAFLISILSFSIIPTETDPRADPRFGLPVGGLFAAVGNKYIIDSLLPEASAFTLVDTLHLLTFFSIFLTLAISAVLLKLHDKGKKDKARKYNVIARNWLIAIYVLANIIFVSLAIID
jgi:hypothetical protein